MTSDRLTTEIDTAAEHIRTANHLTYQRREVTELYAVVGALSVLTRRLPQLVEYLHDTIRKAYSADYCHDTGGSVEDALLAAECALIEAKNFLCVVYESIGIAHNHLSHIGLDIREWVCPECGEPAEPGIPADLTPGQREAPPRFRHHDGTQLCPVLGARGYQPADAQPATRPIARKDAY